MLWMLRALPESRKGPVLAHRQQCNQGPIRERGNKAEHLKLR